MVTEAAVELRWSRVMGVQRTRFGRADAHCEMLFALNMVRPSAEPDTRPNDARCVVICGVSELWRCHFCAA